MLIQINSKSNFDFPFNTNNYISKKRISINFKNYSSGLVLEIMLTPGQTRPIGESETK
jgi:hypothetical protein